MDTMVRCDCGEAATVNNCSKFNDYTCTHCGESYNTKYGKYTQAECTKVEDVYTSMVRNRREYSERGFRKTKWIGFW